MFLCIITHVNSHRVIKKLQQDGWFRVAQAGSHVQFKHARNPD
ncbi:MAG TPA: type II toxin-antitoxin system HicA family toxin [Stellaceae bacterium]|nr:type II toxin-antitoxin system HicA family toxin [Stellaceae bacterium]